MAENLNHLTIPSNEHQEGSIPLEDHQCHSHGVHVYFKNLEHHLVTLINGADAVVGCVAWLTSKPILEALARTKHGVSVIIQKEDFMRPDKIKVDLRQLYTGTHGLWLPQCDGLVRGLSQRWLSGESVPPIRCMGTHNRQANKTAPRMHHKFMVFCETNGDFDSMNPYAVWTGSFNMTYNSTLSFENAVVLHDPKIVNAYYQEWQQVLALSEPLDWTESWVAPEYYIGT